MSISLWIEVYIFVKKMLFLINREIKRVNQLLTCVELKRKSVIITSAANNNAV